MLSDVPKDISSQCIVSDLSKMCILKVTRSNIRVQYVAESPLPTVYCKPNGYFPESAKVSSQWKHVSCQFDCEKENDVDEQLTVLDLVQKTKNSSFKNIANIDEIRTSYKMTSCSLCCHAK